MQFRQFASPATMPRLYQQQVLDLQASHAENARDALLATRSPDRDGRFRSLLRPLDHTVAHAPSENPLNNLQAQAILSRSMLCSVYLGCGERFRFALTALALPKAIALALSVSKLK